MFYNIEITLEDKGVRVDVFLTEFLEDFSRVKIKKLITLGNVLVNGLSVKPSYLLNEGDFLEVTVEVEEKVLKPVNLNIEVLYEDVDLLVVNKPAGLTVHPSESSSELTLVNHLLYHTNSLSLKGGTDRPGIVHRLDKDTSGLLVVAKTDSAYDSLVGQLKERTAKREYLAVVHHPFIESSGTIDAPIKRDKVKMAVDKEGKNAITHFEVINQNELYSYIKCNLVTGRTHQIRVHLAYINHPIVADSTYGTSKEFIKYTHLLHATKLEFIHPTTKKHLTFTKEAPALFKEVLTEIGLA